MLAKVISKAQNAFVDGRQILDAMLIANEVIDLILKSNEGVILCKLDIEKAYDHVEWSFFSYGYGENGVWGEVVKVDQVVFIHSQFFCFGQRNSFRFFQSSRGLRQGDPLSPYLFLIAMEALSCLLKRAVCGGLLLTYQVRGRDREGVEVSHLLFVIDTLIFCEA